MMIISDQDAKKALNSLLQEKYDLNMSIKLDQEDGLMTSTKILKRSVDVSNALSAIKNILNLMQTKR